MALRTSTVDAAYKVMCTRALEDAINNKDWAFLNVRCKYRLELLCALADIDPDLFRKRMEKAKRENLIQIEKLKEIENEKKALRLGWLLSHYN